MKLCVALDLPTKEENISLVKQLKGFDVWLKVGLRSYIRDGKPLLDEIKSISSSFRIFLDLKIHDIPNTMADAAESMVGLGVDMFNVHASSGKIAMSEVMQRLSKFENPPIVLAVTALTSFDEEGFFGVYNETIASKVIRFSQDAYESGLNGVVCSVYESRLIKSHTCERFLTLTPGIRPFGEASDDQQRVADIAKAKEEASDFIVVGRPIYRSNDPRGIVQKIVQTI